MKRSMNSSFGALLGFVGAMFVSDLNTVPAMAQPSDPDRFQPATFERSTQSLTPSAPSSLQATPGTGALVFKPAKPAKGAPAFPAQRPSSMPKSPGALRSSGSPFSASAPSLPFCTNPVTLTQGNSWGFLSYTAMSGRTLIYNDQTNTAAGSITYAHDAGSDGIFGTADDTPGIILGQSYNEWGASVSGRYAVWQRNHLSSLEYMLYDAGPNAIFGDADDIGLSSIGSIQNQNLLISALPRISGDIVSWHEGVTDVLYWCTLANTPGVTSCMDQTRVDRFDSRDLSAHWFVRDAFVHADAVNRVPHIFFTGWDMAQWKARVMSYPGLNAALRVEQSDARVGSALYGFNFLSNTDFTQLSFATVGGSFRLGFGGVQGGPGNVRNPHISRTPGVLGDFLVVWENYRSYPHRMLIEVGPLLHAMGPQSLMLPNLPDHHQLYPSIDGNAVAWLDYPIYSGVTTLQTSYCAF